MLEHQGVNLLRAYYQHRRRRRLLFGGVIVCLVSTAVLAVGFEYYRLAAINRFQQESRLAEVVPVQELTQRLQAEHLQEVFWQDLRQRDQAFVTLAAPLELLWPQHPPEISLTMVEIRPSGEVLLSGTAASGEACVEYYQSLIQEPAWQDVQLLSSQRQVNVTNEEETGAEYRLAIQAVYAHGGGGDTHAAD